MKCPLCWIAEAWRAYRGRAWTRAHRRRSPLCPYRNDPPSHDHHTRVLCEHEEATGCLLYSHVRTSINEGRNCAEWLSEREEAAR